MPCEDFQDALIEAASGASPATEDLRAHLDACAACRATLAREQFLFSSIDSGLRLAANAEVPASFLPRFHSVVAKVTAPRRVWPFVLASACTVAVVAIFVLAPIFRRTGVAPRPVEATKSGNIPATATPVVEAPAPAAVTPGRAAARHRVNVTRATPSETVMVGGATAEVIVPPDQEVLLAQYAAQWQKQKRAPLVIEESAELFVALLQITPIQISQLDVKLLAEERDNELLRNR